MTCKDCVHHEKFHDEAFYCEAQNDLMDETDDNHAEDRCHRIGQRDTVRVFHIVAAGSIDARLVRAVVNKQQVIEEITK